MENRTGRRKATARYSLVELAEELGFTIKKVGRNYCSLVEHDSVMINLNKNTFKQYSTGQYGDPVAFLMTFGETMDTRFKSVDYAIRYLEKALHIAPEKKVDIKRTIPKREVKPLVLPPADISNKRVIHYLEDVRGIDRDVIDFFINKKMLYQEKDRYKNCVFVSYSNNQPVFASKRSSSAHLRFMMEFADNDYDHCFFLDNNAETMIVTESVIDMMSIMTLSNIDEVYKKQSFLSINSVNKYNAVFTHLKENPKIKKVILALDNDEAGVEAIEKIKQKIETSYKGIKAISFTTEAPYKDWNEKLVGGKMVGATELEKEDKRLEI